MTDIRQGLPSASELHRVIACPGYLQLKAELQKQTGIGSKPKDAQFGDDVHALMSGELKEMDAGERAAWVAKQCEKIRAKLVHEILGEEPLNTCIETRFWLSNAKGEKVFSAQVDYAGTLNVTDGKWLLIDYKSLPGQVNPSSENWQLLSQAVCLGDDDEIRGPLPVDEVYCAIVQPLISTKPEVVKFTVQDLIRAKALIIKKLDESKTPNAPRIPGPHCKFCACADQCPEASGMVVALANEFSLGVAHLTPAMIAEIIPRFAAIEKIMKDVKERAKALAAQGELPGYTLKEIQGDRFLPDIQAARDLFKDWISKEEILSMLRLPLTKLREKFVDKYSTEKGVTKVEAGEEFDKLVEAICQREKPSKRLVKSG